MPAPHPVHDRPGPANHCRCPRCNSTPAAGRWWSVGSRIVVDLGADQPAAARATGVLNEEMQYEALPAFTAKLNWFPKRVTRLELEKKAGTLARLPFYGGVYIAEHNNILLKVGISEDFASRAK